MLVFWEDWWIISKYFAYRGYSFWWIIIYIRNNKGLRTEPCGTIAKYFAMKILDHSKLPFVYAPWSSFWLISINYLLYHKTLIWTLNLRAKSCQMLFKYQEKFLSYLLEGYSQSFHKFHLKCTIAEKYMKQLA